jgi:microcystin-dependent protein
MSYTITKSDGTTQIVVEDKQLNQDTSIQLVGKNSTGYAKVISESFVRMLENFAHTEPPNNAIPGQLWYDTDSNSNPPKPQLKVLNPAGQWVSASNVTRSVNQPTAPTVGDLWVDIAKQQLYIWSGSNSNYGGILYNFSPSTVNLTPGRGRIRANSVTATSVTEFYVSNLDFYGNQFGDIYQDWSQGNSEGYLHVIGNTPTSSTYGIFKLVSVEDGPTADYQIVTVSQGIGTMPQPAEPLSIYFSTSAVKGDIDFTLAQGSWILVGPHFSAGSLTGPVTESVIDVSNVSQKIIKFLVDNETLAILSNRAFTPKSAIPGFTSQSGPAIKQGLNLSTGFTDNKIWGVADAAENVKIGNQIVSASQLVRSDSPSYTVGLDIRSNTGLTVGVDSTTRLGNTSAGDGLLSNTTSGKSIIFRATSNAGLPENTLVVSAGKVGVNNLQPDEAIDVVGRIKSSAGLVVTSTSEANSDSSGSIITAGGIGVKKGITLGGGINANGLSKMATVEPTVNNIYNLGAVDKKWANIHAVSIQADRVYGTFTGNVDGSVSGSAGRLATPTTFALVGEIENVNTVQFNGTASTVEFNTVITQDVFENRGSLDSDSLLYDQILINRPNIGLRRITKEKFISNIPTVPIGAVFPFAGTLPPAGYLWCDGSELAINEFTRLFNSIGETYGTPSAPGRFRLPDLRGRFPLGRETMNNYEIDPVDPNRVSGSAPDQLGGESGNELGQVLSVSGQAQSSASGKAVNVMNPFLTLNYIIFTGVL